MLGASPCAVPKVSHQKATAFFRATPGSVSIDKENGILRGVKVMEVGVMACFTGADGKPWRTKITPAHIDALLGFAGNRTAPAHYTHEWHDAEAKKQSDADSVELAARCGAWKNFRKDENGNAVADAYLRNDDHREEILFAAEHDPENLMASAVFSYDPQDNTAMPTSFRCVDFVPVGAATTALFSEADPNQTNMDDIISQLAEACKDPHKLAAFKALMKSVESASKDEGEESAAAEMESAAGVEDGDKKKEDGDKPALMRACIRVARALTRKTDSVAVNETALLAKAEVAGKAGATALLGKSGFHIQDGGTEGADKYTATLALFTAKEPNEQRAVFAMLKAHPEFTAEHDAKMRERVAKLRPVS